MKDPYPSYSEEFDIPQQVQVEVSIHLGPLGHPSIIPSRLGIFDNNPSIHLNFPADPTYKTFVQREGIDWSGGYSGQKYGSGFFEK